MAGIGILVNKIVALQGLKNPLHRGRAEAQFMAQVSNPPFRPILLKFHQYLDRLFNGVVFMFDLFLFHNIKHCFIDGVSYFIGFVKPC